MSLAMEQNSLFIQDRLASRENLRTMASLNEVSGIPKLIEEVCQPWLAHLPCSFLECHNILGPDKCDTESSRKKVEAAHKCLISEGRYFEGDKIVIDK